jgi:hypothetical protein
MRQNTALLLILFFYSSYSFGINPDRKLKAHRIQEEIRIDGSLLEKVWHNTETATDFIVTEPVPGAQATYKTSVIFYTMTTLFTSAPECTMMSRARY